MYLTDKERCGKSPWKNWGVDSFKHYFSVRAILLALAPQLARQTRRATKLPRASDAKKARDIS